MALYKKGTCSSSVTVASSVYSCKNCGYTETTGDTEENKSCPHCDFSMTLIKTEPIDA